MKILNNKIKKEELKDLKELLIVIDMVNGFIKEGTLASPSIKRIIPRIQELLKENENSPYMANMFIRDTHEPTSREFKTYQHHCIKGTKEVLVVDELEPYYKNAFDFEKNSTDFMLAPNVIPFFECLPYLEKIKLVGCLSDVCVKNGAITAKNYFDEVNRDVEVYVYADAIDTFDAPEHNAKEVNERSIKDMKANEIKILGKALR